DTIDGFQPVHQRNINRLVPVNGGNLIVHGIEETFNQVEIGTLPQSSFVRVNGTSSIDLSGIRRSFQFIGGSRDDLMVINGAEALPFEVFFEGGGQAGDTLELNGPAG